jgi:ATP-dependent DNA helicase HFM1/MER3
VKVIYIAPMKALCHERVNDWQQKFAKLNLTCNELTGDTDYTQSSKIKSSNIIVTTPEKWDSTTRKWRDQKNLMKLICLLLIDEIHTVKEGSRGATLEVIVSRMKIVARECGHRNNNLRIVAVSATIPNLQDIGDWLCDSSGNPAQVRLFGEEYRPVQISKHVLSYPASTSKNPFQFEKSLDYRLFETLSAYSDGKPTLVVVHFNPVLLH